MDKSKLGSKKKGENLSDYDRNKLEINVKFIYNLLNVIAKTKS